MYIPDVLWPTDNEFGIPLLDKELQGEFIETPVVKWGTIKRSSLMLGTYHFYTDDYKFSGLWSNPASLLSSNCRVIIEPNVSTTDHMPFAVGLYKIYQKRWLARYCQSQGIRVFVDMCIEREFADYNLLGVPKGWNAYANRGYSDDRHKWLEEDYERAQEHAGRKSIMYAVYGGGKRTRQLCLDYGWTWIPEQADSIRGRFRDDSARLTVIKEIKEALQKDSRTQQELADMFGVTQATISDIKTGKTWSDDEPDM